MSYSREHDDVVRWLADPDCDRTTEEEKAALLELLADHRQLKTAVVSLTMRDRLKS